MADQYDFTPKVNPMQGITLADLVAAKTPALTSVLQSVPALTQALQQRKAQIQQQQAISAMQQPGMAQGQASLTPEQIQALLPVLGSSAVQYGQGFSPQRGLNFQKEQAQTQDIQAQVQQRLGAGQKGQGQYSLTPEEEDALTKAVQQGMLAPAQLTFRGPKTKILAGLFMKDPNFNAMNPDVQFTSQKAGSTATAKLRGGKAQEVAAMAGTVEDTLDAVEPMLSGLSPTQVAMINKAYQSGLQQINDPQANEALALLNEATALQATVLHGGGTPTDQDMALARSYLRPGLSQRGFSGVKKAIAIVNQSRVKRLTGQINSTNFGPTKKVSPKDDPLGIF